VSESHPYSKLDDSRKIILRGYLAKLSAAATAAVGRAELMPIEAVEKLGAELGAYPLIWAEFGVLEQAKVEVLRTVGTNIRFCARIVAVAVIRRSYELRRVEPVGQLLIQAAGGQRRKAGSYGLGTARVWNARVAKRTGTPANDNGEAALEGNDGVESPSSDDFIGDSAHVAQEPLAPANG
jgi:hypothetical protein